MRTQTFPLLALGAAALCFLACNASSGRPDTGADVDTGEITPFDSGSTEDADDVGDGLDVVPLDADDTRTLPDGAADTAGDAEPSGDAHDASTDVANLPDDFGQPCSEARDCASGHCMESELGRVCSARCRDDGCPAPEWDCAPVELDAEIFEDVCAPPTGLLCSACTPGASCLGGVCVEMLDGDVCVPRCAGDADCPETFACSDAGICLPSDRVCADICLDDDNDGYGIGDACLDHDCDDTNPARYRGASELCDGVDNDCDEVTDEGISNVCGGCQVLAQDVGAPCGACGSYACAEDGSLWCDDRSRNACGGCAELPTLDDACGSGCGTVICDVRDPNGDSVRCDDIPANSCGSCQRLLGTPGTSCGAGCGTWVCEPSGNVACVDDAENACGGCMELEGRPGAPCGCAGVWACDGNEGVVCTDERFNACGGCGTLGFEPGAACGRCGAGVGACNADGTIRCDESALALNACGGCEPLEAEPGTPCGRCPHETGEYVCDGRDAVECTSQCALWIDAPTQTLRIDTTKFRFNDTPGTRLSEQIATPQRACVEWYAQGEGFNGAEYWLLDTDGDGVAQTEIPDFERAGVGQYGGAVECDARSLSVRFSVVKCGGSDEVGTYLDLGGENDARTPGWMWWGKDTRGLTTWGASICMDEAGAYYPCGPESTCHTAMACGTCNPFDYTGRSCAAEGISCE